MRTLRIGRTFDVVFIHDAIDHMATQRDLRLALETAFLHCTPGELALVVPDYVRGTFEPSTDYGGCDGEDRALRYLEWTYDPDDADTTYTVEYAYLLRENGQPTSGRARPAYLRALPACRADTALVRGRLQAGDRPRPLWARRIRRTPPETLNGHQGREAQNDL
jgi:hypothetical protein